jgi:hypothetical protein
VRRHDVDPVALLAGALFVAVGIAYLNGALTDTDVHARWILPSLLIVLGLGGLLATLVNIARHRRQTPMDPRTDEAERADVRPWDSSDRAPLETLAAQEEQTDTHQADS